MKRFLLMLGAVLGLLACADAGSAAGTERNGERTVRDMVQSPQQRVMAYHKNLLDAANLLRQEISSTGTLQRSEALRSVARMKQNLAQMQKHLGTQKRAMADGARNASAGKTPDVTEAGVAQSRKHLNLLEQELNTNTPDPKRLRLELDGLVRECELMQMDWRKNRPAKPVTPTQK